MPDWNAAEIEKVIRLQTAEINRLRLQVSAQEAEITGLLDFINGDAPGALEVLRRQYSNADLPESLRLRAAQAAIGYEVPKPASTTISIDIAAEINRSRLNHQKLVQEGRAPPPTPCPTNAISDWTLQHKPEKAQWAADYAAKTIEHQAPALGSDNASEAAGEPDPAA
jgi:hypothetical protein